jgi:hypothetical protein
MSKPDGCNCRGEVCRMPRWVVDGWYSNNPMKQQMAVANWHRPVTTPRERQEAREALANASPEIQRLTAKIRAEMGWTEADRIYRGDT